MDDFKVPTLQRLSIKGVLILLWNRDDTKRLIESKLDTIFHKNIKEWERVEDKIKQDVLHLLPKKIANEFGDHLRPIGLELLAWIEFHFVHVKLKPKIPDKISWTSKGSIDLVKTAEILIKDESVGLYDRYKLACAFCLETPIRELWGRVDQNDIKQDEYGLVVYWSHWNQKRVPKTLKSELLPQSKPHDWGFQCSVQSANITAAKYFFEKSKPKEGKKIFYLIEMLLPYQKKCDGCKWTKGYFLKKYCFDFFLFASRDMSEEQRNICRDYLATIHPYRRCFPDCLSLEQYLTGFLDWPFQEILLDTAVVIWNRIPPSGKETYSGFLYAVLQKIIKGQDDHDYIGLFKTFWEHLPNSEKKHIMNDSLRYWMKVDIEKFAEANDFSLNFEDWVPSDMAAAKQTEKIGLYSDSSDFGLLKFYILACMCPHDIMIKYKDDYKERIFKKFELEFSRPDWGANEYLLLRWRDFFECLDEFIEHEEAEKSLEKNYKCPAGKEIITKPIYEDGRDDIRTRSVGYRPKPSRFCNISETISAAVSKIPTLFNKMKNLTSKKVITDD